MLLSWVERGEKSMGSFLSSLESHCVVSASPQKCTQVPLNRDLIGFLVHSHLLVPESERFSFHKFTLCFGEKHLNC